MIDELPNAHLITALVWVALTVISYGITKIADKYQKQQDLIEFEYNPPVGKQGAKYFIGNILFGIFLFFLGSLIDEYWFKFFFGGFVFA